MGEQEVPYQVTQGGPGERLPVAIGTGIWALLFVLGLMLRPELESSGRGWWVWAAFSGVLLGFVGYSYLLIRRPRPKPGQVIPPSTYSGDVDDVTRGSGEPTGLPRLRRKHPPLHDAGPATRSGPVPESEHTP
ncbi:hypothetical protein KIH74_01010 [Kineosporia sp. J2-2]|uniref:DUF2530 domain-containing protein n=1 Tax=Kineosporia corallincola TaxID=2835133 RepID=A0ABS5T8T9_9ACTN|nr:hypothetical protein [Kineosporia corallincola]MBT0767481.1 hypothetical protein [Kineosporia corallincola]